MESKHNFSQANKRLSLLAIEYACDLCLLGENNISSRLYLYGRIPLSSYWLYRFPQSQTIYEAILATQDGRNAILSSQWSEKPAVISNDRWTIFRNKNWEQKSFTSAPFKLYVNLHPDSFVREFNTIINCLTSFDIPIFKFAKDAYNLVRPDKFVAYIMDFEKLIDLGIALSASLKTAEVQPLPFTAAFDDTGVVSCGFDPPSNLAQSFKATSWRSFITQTIGEKLSEGRRLKMKKKELVQYIMYSLNVLGVNVEKWLPKVIN